MSVDLMILASVLTAGVVRSVRKRKLTFPAALTGAGIACLVYAGAGFTGVAMMTAFFLSGSIATSWKMKTKASMGLAESADGSRRAKQVFANAGASGIAGLLSILYPNQALYFQVLMAGSFAAAAGDTLSSELGNIYGTKYVNILTLKKDQRGLNGVVSLEGTLAGLGGSIMIALIFALGTGGYRYMLPIIIGGLVGNLIDSLLGATLERSSTIDNEAVNFINTVCGALTSAGLLYLFFADSMNN